MQLNLVPHNNKFETPLSNLNSTDDMLGMINIRPEKEGNLKHVTSKYSEAVAECFGGKVSPWKAITLILQFILYSFKIYIISSND